MMTATRNQAAKLANMIELTCETDDQAMTLVNAADPQIIRAVMLAEEGIGSDETPLSAYPRILRRIATA